MCGIVGVLYTKSFIKNNLEYGREVIYSETKRENSKYCAPEYGATDQVKKKSFFEKNGKANIASCDGSESADCIRNGHAQQTLGLTDRQILVQDSNQENNKYYLFNYLYNSLYYLQTRGYDSVGICSLNMSLDHWMNIVYENVSNYCEFSAEHRCNFEKEGNININPQDLHINSKTACASKVSHNQEMTSRNSYFYASSDSNHNKFTKEKNDMQFNISKYSVDESDNPDGEYIFNLLKNDYYKHMSHIGIGHTRWATLGQKNNMNAHPHLSNNNNIAVVHNGHLDNSQDLLGFLEKKGYTFSSKTDSEIIPVYLEYLEKKHPKESFCSIMMKLQEHLLGKWACLVLHKKFPNHIYFFKYNMPLMISRSLHNDKKFNKHVLVSDPNNFLDNFEEYYCLGEKAVGYVTFDKVFIQDKNYQIYPILTDHIDLKYLNYETQIINTNYVYTLQNLDNMYETIANVKYEYVIRNKMLIKDFRYFPGSKNIQFHALEPFKAFLASLSHCRHIVFIGLGTSFHSCLSIKTVYQELEIFDTVSVYDASEFNVYDLTQLSQSVFFVVSQSSENKYIENVVNNILSLNSESLIFGIFNNTLASFAKEKLKGHISLNSGKDFAYSFVKSFFSQYFTLYLLGNYFVCIRSKNFIGNTIVQADPVASSSEHGFSFSMCRYIFNELENDIHFIIKSQHVFQYFAKYMTDCDNILILGKNELYPIALECAHKFREISYVNAFGISFSQLKQGYLNIISDKTAIIILTNKHKNYIEYKNLIQELKLDNNSRSKCTAIFILTNESEPDIQQTNCKELLRQSIGKTTNVLEKPTINYKTNSTYSTTDSQINIDNNIKELISQKSTTTTTTTTTTTSPRNLQRGTIGIPIVVKQGALLERSKSCSPDPSSPSSWDSFTSASLSSTVMSAPIQRGVKKSKSKSSLCPSLCQTQSCNPNALESGQETKNVNVNSLINREGRKQPLVSQETLGWPDTESDRISEISQYMSESVWSAPVYGVSDENLRVQSGTMQSVQSNIIQERYYSSSLTKLFENNENKDFSSKISSVCDKEKNHSISSPKKIISPPKIFGSPQFLSSSPQINISCSNNNPRDTSIQNQSRFTGIKENTDVFKTFYCPNSPFLNSMYLLSCSYIAYYLAVLKNINPDRPKISNKMSR